MPHFWWQVKQTWPWCLPMTAMQIRSHGRSWAEELTCSGQTVISGAVDEEPRQVMVEKETGWLAGSSRNGAHVCKVLMTLTPRGASQQPRFRCCIRGQKERFSLALRSHGAGE